ncbi:MAG: ribonuclease PH [Candidatus Babeliales bacterium]|nr:ribonuclease PH [Candidatus Babeliales bacterium]
MIVSSLKRSGGRANDHLRPLKASFDVFGYTAGSILFEIGNTKVLCSVTMQPSVPPFLKGKGTGWLSAEYSMLPTATTIRTQRESTTMKKNGRSVEISRLISRALRSVIALDKLGERTITIDCDVLQADGGTRTACITGAYFALEHALNYWVSIKQVSPLVLKDSIVAVSAGIFQGVAVLDPDFAEDSAIDSDFNFVITKSDAIIEVQGTAEKQPVTWDQFEQLKNLALSGSHQLFDYFATLNRGPQSLITPIQIDDIPLNIKEKPARKNQAAPMFSLMNRTS